MSGSGDGGRIISGTMYDFSILTNENTNTNEELDFNIDLGLRLSRQLKSTPLYWSIGLTLSKSLTEELWNGDARFKGDDGTYAFDMSTSLSFIGIELGIIYKLKRKSPKNE
jgi:hypothetical protein